MQKVKENQKIRKCKKEKIFLYNKGVTLIALVITITILLILAGIGIAALTGENGLIKKASSAKENTEVAQETEMLQQAAIVAMGKSKTGDVEKDLLDIELAKYSGISGTNQSDNGVEVTFNNGRKYLVDPDGNVSKIKVLPIETDVAKLTTPVSENTKYNDGTDIAVIPKGFRISSEPSEQTIDTGLVVLDGSNNEWVWIPVDDVTDMYDEIPKTALCGDTGITTTKASKSGIISQRRRNLPGVDKGTSSREPDLITYNNSVDLIDYNMAGFGSSKDMAEEIVISYNNMIKSVGKYGGFYVGRYELTGSITTPTEIAGAPIKNQNWYFLYKACKYFSNDIVESRMIWGNQWDVICNYIALDENYSITNSSDWGNYKNTEVLSSDGEIVLKESETRHSIDTGITTFTMAKNIYDIAGNYMEWTQEAYGSDGRSYRGGSYVTDGMNCSASYSGFNSPSSNVNSSRPTLYIK